MPRQPITKLSSRISGDWEIEAQSASYRKPKPQQALVRMWSHLQLIHYSAESVPYRPRRVPGLQS
jgi:hypothetical protein